MNSRSLLHTREWPAEFAQMAQNWSQDAACQLVSYIWRGFDALASRWSEKQLTIEGDEVSIERAITQLLVPCIMNEMPPESAFFVMHGPYEFETIAIPKAQPPQPDIGFFSYSNQRAMWPVEAKVIKENDASEYSREVIGNFLTCRYGPFSTDGAMLGYLVSGDLPQTFESIESCLGCALLFIQEQRPGYRYSNHSRTVPAGKAYPSAFRCHHLILEFRS